MGKAEGGEMVVMVVGGGQISSSGSMKRQGVGV
jgi:hypothetical protein